MLVPSDKCYQTIEKWETCVLVAYPDPASPLASVLRQRGLWAATLAGQPIPPSLLNSLKGDPWTIGWGHTGPDVKYGVRWTQDEADRDLYNTVLDVWGRVQSALTRTPTQDQLDAIISWAYNVGTAAAKTSTLIRKFNAGDNEGAANEFRRWNKAGGQILKGLSNRRASEEKLFRGDPNWLQ